MKACGEIDTTTGTAPPPTAPPAVQPTEAPPTVKPIAQPTVMPTVEPTPEPVIVSGSGKVATDNINVPFAISVLTIRHTGSGHFAVQAYQGDGSDLLVNIVGNYTGKRWLAKGDYIFDISADGAWEIVISRIGLQEAIAEDGFFGEGDEVCGLFMPPSTKAWELSHNGTGHFAVIAICAGGRNLIANEVGKFSGSGVVRFPEGPCFFEVSADGAFSVKHR